jgi:hypothetical protein
VLGMSENMNFKIRTGKKKNTRHCWYCRRTKPKEEFYKDKHRGGGYSSRCKSCDSQLEKIRRRETTLHKQCIKKLGNKCVRCGFSDKRALQIDHINGGGRKEIASFKSSKSYYRNVLSDTTGKYQVLCSNCNWIKSYENKERKSKTPSIIKRSK